MLSIRKRKCAWFVDFTSGGTRIRGTLGTRDKANARHLAARIEAALCAGKDSPLWGELKAVLAESTFTRFAEHAGVKERQAPTWEGLRETFEAHMKQRVELGKFSQFTMARYLVTLRDFGKFLGERGVTLLGDVTKPSIENFKAWQLARIKSKKFSRGGGGLALDTAILHRVFSFAVETECVIKNPVRMEGRPGENPSHGAEPFTAGELSCLREQAGEDMLIFLLLRHTGFRASDAAGLTWGELRFDTKEIERVTQKRRKKVILPIHAELFFALEAERDRRKPEAADRVLLNPSNGKPTTRTILYNRVRALGERAGVPGAHPHRFRDTLAVDTLLHGGTVYDAAKALGDTVETVERHYAPFVPELRERLRKIMESPGGLEYDRQSDRKIESLKRLGANSSHWTAKPQ
jgi:integrase